MKNWIKQNPLQSMAVVIWLLIGASLLAREMTVFSTAMNFSNQFLSLNHFFDDAAASLHHDWDKWEKDMADFDKRFNEDSDRFHAYVEKHTQQMLNTLGYDYSNGSISLKKEPPKPPEKSFSQIQAEWHDYMNACKRGDGSRKSEDAYVKCLQDYVKKEQSSRK